MGKRLFLDPNRCVGCRACMAACRQCESHQGIPMVYVDTLDAERSPATRPAVCMHCHEPACAAVCPADAIKLTADGVAQMALVERCLYCRNCVFACPFGIPRYDARQRVQVKCNLCYDRTSVGKSPMCAAVCPTGALTYGEYDEVVAGRRGAPVNTFRFADQEVTTRVVIFAPHGTGTIHTTALDVSTPEATYLTQTPGQQSIPFPPKGEMELTVSQPSGSPLQGPRGEEEQGG